MASVITLGDKTTYDPLKLWDQCLRQALPADLWFGKANRFSCPLGPEPGSGTLLMAAEDVTPLLETRPDLVFDDGEKRVVLKKLVITAAETITWGVRGDLAALRVVTVKDRRHLLKQVPINRGYNLYDCQGTSLAGTAGYTWQSMVTAIVNLFDDLDALTLPVTPDDAPRNFDFYGDWYAWEALSIVLDRLGCAVKYDPFRDRFSVVQLGAADAAADSFLDGLDSSRLADPEPAKVKLGRIPQTARVLFKKLPPPTDGSSWWTVVEKPVPGGGPAGTVNLVDDMPDTPATAALRDARATARAADVGREWSPGSDRFNREYSGVVADPKVLPGSRVHAVAWGDVGRGLKTSVYRGEGVVLPEGIARKFRPYDPNCGQSCTGQITVVTGVCVSEDNTTNTTQTADYHMTLADRNVDVDATAGPVTVWLPPSSQITSQEFPVQKTDATGNMVNVVRGDYAPITGNQGGTARDRVISLLLDSQYAGATFYKQSSGPEAGQVVTTFPLLLYASPNAVMRTKNTVGGSGTTAQPSPGMVVTTFPLMTY